MGIYQELSELVLDAESHRAVFIARRRPLEDLDDLSPDLFDDLEDFSFVLEE